MADFEQDVILRLNLITREISELRRQVTALRSSGPGGSHGGDAVAPDGDLDGKYGDPEVKIAPKDWNGPNYKGRRYSQCDPEFLDKLASLLAWKSQKNADEGNDNYAKYDRLDAARARGWAARLRRQGIPGVGQQPNGKQTEARSGQRRPVPLPEPPPGPPDDYDVEYGGCGADDDVPF